MTPSGLEQQVAEALNRWTWTQYEKQVFSDLPDAAAAVVEVCRKHYEHRQVQREYLAALQDQLERERINRQREYGRHRRLLYAEREARERAQAQAAFYMESRADAYKRLDAAEKAEADRDDAYAERNEWQERVAELEEAIRETLCDDVPCSRCDHFRAALSPEKRGDDE